MKIWPCILVVFCSILLTNCRAPKDLIFRDYKNLRLENVNFSDADVKVDLVYYNPNNIGLQLSRTDLDLYIDNTFLGHSAQDIQINIPARKEFTVPLSLKIDMKNLLKNGLTTLFNKEINVRLVGNVKVGKAGIYKLIKVDYTSKQNFSMFK